MDMVAKPLLYNQGQRKGIVLYPNWICDNKLPTSCVRSVTDFIDRGGGPSSGDGSVFIGHHSSDKVPDAPDADGYHFYIGGDYEVYDSGSIISAVSHPFYETNPTNKEFDFNAWFIHEGTLYEFNLEGYPLSYGGTYTGHYSYDRLYWVRINRFPDWGGNTVVQRDSPGVVSHATQLGGGFGYLKSNAIWEEALRSDSLSTIYGRFCDICVNADKYYWGGAQQNTMGVIGFGTPTIEPCDLNVFVFPKNQYNYWCSRVADFPGHVCDGINTAFFSDAYYRAVDKLPKLKQNLLANILDIVGGLKSFKNGYKAIYSAKEFASSAWLAYRYAYSTTKQDLEEATNYLGRLYYLLETEATVVRSYGVHLDGGSVYRCTLECDFRALMSASLLEKISKQYNFRLSITNVWDMIPFSFVVDWFLGIGDILEEIDQWLDSASIPVTKIWYSYNETYITPTGDESVYFRWDGKAPSLPYFTDFYSSKSASSVTLVKRGLDSLALIF